MKKYIAFLRGINVGGHRPLKMEELRELFGGLGFNNVSTHIQSGNVIFDADEEADLNFLSTKIKVQIKETFGYDIPVVLRTPSDLENTLSSFPYDHREGWKGYISFLAHEPMGEQAAELESMSSDIEQFEIRGLELYSFVDKQTNKKPKFSNSFVEKKLGVPTTTRNLRTVDKILELAASSN